MVWLRVCACECVSAADVPTCYTASRSRTHVAQGASDANGLARRMSTASASAESHALFFSCVPALEFGWALLDSDGELRIRAAQILVIAAKNAPSRQRLRTGCRA